MDRPPRDSRSERVASERVVQVHSGHDDLTGVTGSGYVVAPGLILTSAHVIDPAAPCHVRGTGPWTRARPVWHGRGPLAAALLHIPGVPTPDPSPDTSRTGGADPSGRNPGSSNPSRLPGGAALPGGSGGAAQPSPAGEPGSLYTSQRGVSDASGVPWEGSLGPVRWGRVTRDGVRCVVRGFARVDSRGEPLEGGTVSVVAAAGAGTVPASLEAEFSGSPPGAFRLGFSGAALLAEPTGQLVGVLVSWYEDGHADVVPVEALLLDDTFRAWVEGDALPASGLLEDVSGDERVVLLPDLLEPATGEPPENCPDWSLPVARHAVVPFVGRKAELTALRNWAAGPEPLSAALITGPGGSGKSRLAVELCAELSAAGWDAGLLPATALVGPLSDPAVRLDASRPTLLVLDFPEPSAALVAELVRGLAAHRHNPRIRLLLVARTSVGAAPPPAAWWRRLDTAAGGRLKRLIRATVRLEDHPLTLPERAGHAAAAIRAFATRPGAGDGLDRIRPFPLDDPLYAVPLRVHLAALMRVRGHEAGPGNELVHRFLNRERERWSRSPGAPDDGVAGAAVAVAMLFAPSPRELRALLSVVPGLDEGRMAEVATWVAGLFPPDVRGGQPPEQQVPAVLPGTRLVIDVPDVVVGQVLEETAGLESLVTAVHDHPGRTAAHLARMLDVLRVCADHGRVRGALRSLVVHRLDRMLCEAAMGPGEQLGDRLNAVLQLLRDEPEVAGAVAALPPWQAGHPGVRALRVTLAEMLVERLRGGKRADVATALSTASVWLAAAGRLPEAVAAAGEAAEIFTAAPPYEQAEGQAEALFNQAACLLLSGVPELAVRPAREAAARFRILVEEDPRYAAHAERAQYNLACALAGTGRLREAVSAFLAAGGDVLLAGDMEAVLSVLPDPAGVSPGLSYGTPSYGEAAGVYLDDDAPYVSARRAGVPLGARPSGGAGLSGGSSPYGGVRPGGEGSLGGSAPGSREGWPLVRGGVLGPLDALDEERLVGLGAGLAVEVAKAVRGLAVTDLEVCRRLDRLGSRLDRRGRGEAAVVVAGEAVVRLRGIAAEEPGLRAVLAGAAGLASRVHGERGDLQAAVRSAGEAVENLRALAVLEPGRHGRELAERLRDLGEYLLLRRLPEEALDSLREAVWVADGLGDGHDRLLAGCRRLLGMCLVELDRPADGLAQFETAAGLLRELGDEDRLRRDVAGWVRRSHALLGHALPPAEPALPDEESTTDSVRTRHRTIADDGRARKRHGTPAENPGPTPRGTPAEGFGFALRGAYDRRFVEGLSLVGVAVRGGESVERAEEALAVLVAGGGTDVGALADAQAHLAWVWAGAGRARDAVVLASRAAGLLLGHRGDGARPQGDRARPGPLWEEGLRARGEDEERGRHGDDVRLWGKVEAALGRGLLGTGRFEEALPHLVAAVDADEVAAERLLLVACAWTWLERWEEAEEAAGRAAELVREPLGRAVALRLLAGARFARGDCAGALEAAGGAVEALPEEATVPRRLLAGTCLQLRGLCRVRLEDDERAGLDLVRGTTLIAGLLDDHGPLAPEPAATHLLALLALGELQQDPAPFLARALEVRPLPPPDALRVLLDGLADHLDGAGEVDLLGPMTAFAEAFTREVPVRARPELHASLGDCLARYAALTGEAAAAEAAVRVFQGLAAAGPRHRARLEVAAAGQRRRARLGVALAALAGIEHELARPVLATLERAAHLLAGTPEKAALARTLALYGDALLGARRPVEALAHLERAADLCDELDEPGVAAMAYSCLGAALAALDRPQAALEAVAWSVAEQERMPEGHPAARARADEVRGLVLRRMGRKRESLAHLVEAVNQYRRLPRTAARRLAEAEVAVVIVDDMLADGRAGEAVEYAVRAVDGYAGCPAARLKQALAKQRLVRCHLMRGALGEAAPLVEELIVDARRAPGDLTYRAVLADSLAQSAELLTMLHLDDGPRAEARAREAIRLYDGLIAAGVGAESVHAGRAGANLSLAAALSSQERYEDEVAPLREAVTALERYAPGNPVLGGHLARAMLMLGDALLAAGRAPEASAVLHRGTRVIRDGYLSAVAHYQLGLCELRLGRDEAADAALRSADARLRELLGDEGDGGDGGDDEELVEMHRDVLRARLGLNERAGRAGEVALVEHDLINLRWFRADGG